MDALTAFGLKASDSAMFADVLAIASARSNTNVSMLGESFNFRGFIEKSIIMYWVKNWKAKLINLLICQSITTTNRNISKV